MEDRHIAVRKGSDLKEFGLTLLLQMGYFKELGGYR